MNFIYKKLFLQVKKIIPKISDTELIALRSGGVSIDRDIFSGIVNLHKLQKNKKELSDKEDTIINYLTNDTLYNIGKQKLYPNKNIFNILKLLGQNGYLSMIIDKQYNGNKLSITAQSKIITKISSFNPSLGVVVMVPNSLGPGELLQHYGTDNQKKYFLPKLAIGDMIPCFGLTGPNNGSDATGEIDEGVMSMINGKKTITIKLNKRYITLAPVANLIGIAFKLKDPDGYLEKGKEGITLALIEKDHPGLLQNTYHNPNNAGFPNGTIKGTIDIKVDSIIGGEEKAGHGWQMLMECLAVGRGVSLPSSSNGASKSITFGIHNYIKHRKQFKMNIGNMEAVKEKYIDMFYNTWVINSSVAFMNHILDEGSVPSVLTAIMKQQTTERSRIILNHGMDIYAGSGICLGDNNFMTDFYNSSPVGITVEGSNTLTRGLIIFGQGLNKSHPHIYNIFDSIQNNDVAKFTNNFNNMVKDVVINYSKSIIPNIHYNTNIVNRLTLLTVKFSNLTNFIALLGGKIKSKQMISGEMADILSNIYLAHSLIWFHNNYTDNELTLLRDFCINKLCNEAEYKLNNVIDNYPNNFIKFLLYPTKCILKKNKYEDVNIMYDFINNNKKVIDIVKEDIYYNDTILSKLDQLNNLDKNSNEYKILYQEIISVGEYQI